MKHEKVWDPDSHLGAMQDKVHESRGKPRAVKARRAKRIKQDD